MKRSSPSGWAHPVWWLALGVLIVNDRFLKDAGLLPSAITGKLSDFAGLIVAPVLLASLVRRPGLRPFAFFLPVFVFVGIKTSATLAASWVAATELYGMPWSVYVDPSDLWALLVLPLAWMLVEPRASVGRSRAAVIIGGVACAASGEPIAPAFIGNRTGEVVDVRVQFANAELDCDALSGRAAQALGREAFGPGTTYRLEPDHTQGLYSTGACGAALIKSDGLADTVIFWNKLTMVELPFVLPDVEDEDPEDDHTDRMVRLIKYDKAVFASSVAPIELSPYVERSEPSVCSAPFAERFGWTGLDALHLRAKVDGIKVLPDGCLAIRVLESEQLYLCIPGEELPFSAGDEVAITSSAREGLVIERVATASVGYAKLTLVARDEPLEIPGLDWSIEPVPCGGDRLACGSYVLPAVIKFSSGAQLTGGSALELKLSRTKRLRIVAGRVEKPIVASPNCEAGRDHLDAHADLLLVERGN